MASPEWSSLLDLYQRIVHPETLPHTSGQPECKRKIKRGIYSVPVVLWLMILQRLQSRGTLASTVQLLLQGAADPLLLPCRRVRHNRISSRTGGYCQARQKLPQLLCRQVSQQIVEQLRIVLNQTRSAGRANIFLVDGSSLELEHDQHLLSRYPPTTNQHGQSHWPTLRIVVMHDAETGLAQLPCWGPMNGPNAVSEQELAEKAMDALPADAVVMGDRNFGIFWLAHAAQQRNLLVVLRLTEARARKLAGPISQPGEYSVVWNASRWDGGKKKTWPATATVPGRLIAVRVGRGNSQQWLYLFTTLADPAADIVQLYGRRWHIETDLRSLKRTVRLHHITAKSDDMLEKELLMAISAYNLVRAVICMAARRHDIEPRQLSFSHVLAVVEAAWPNLIAAPTQNDHNQIFLRVLDLAAQCTLPRRKKHRSFPRLQWRRGGLLKFKQYAKTK